MERRRRAATREAGETLIEATLVLLFLFALIFLLLDLSWAMFAKVTLQHAVRAGVRYAVTSQTSTDGNGNALGQVDSIKQVVATQSMGFLTSGDVESMVTVTFYAVNGGGPSPISGSGSNASGNLVVVSVNNYQVTPFGPLLRSTVPVSFTVSAGDLIEPSPNGPPPL